MKIIRSMAFPVPLALFVLTGSALAQATEMTWA